MFKACICVDNEGPNADVFQERIVVARKEHRCNECHEVIPKGSRYEHVRGLWEGYWETWKTCIPCRNVRNSLFSCGFSYGMIWEDVREAFQADLPYGEKDDFDWLY